MDTLHAEVAAAEAALLSFLKGKSLNDPEVHKCYLPLKQRFDAALEALGRAARNKEA